MQSKVRVSRALLPLLLVVVACAIYFVPVFQVQHATIPDDEAFEAENAARESLVRILGTLCLLGGFYLAWRRTSATERRVAVLEESQLTDRFTRAIDQLSSEQAAVRLGGIFALERIAHESPRDVDAIVSTLCAYVRTHSPWPSESATEFPEIHRPAADVQAALDILSARRGSFVGRGEARIDLSYSDLRGANLAEAELERAILRNSNLEHANLWRANLRGAKLWRARLGNSNHDEAFLDAADTAQTSFAIHEDPQRVLRAADGEVERIADVIRDATAISPHR